MTERIWAPWRMEFIRGADKPSGCVLCGYVAATPSRDNGVLARGRHAYVVLNKYPYTAAHSMVVPFVHTSSLGELEPDAHDELFRLVTRASAALTVVTRAEGMNIGLNLGRAAGAGIHEHLHVHLVPRWTGDNNFMPVLADLRVMPEHLAATWDALRPAFAALEEDRP